MKTIKDKKGQVLVTIFNIKEYIGKEESTFFTEPDESLQIGSLAFKKGVAIEPHIHRKKKSESVYPVSEMLLILYGILEADIYDESKTLIKTVTLSLGDMLISKRGGHGYRIIENTKLLDIRSGKYINKENDKEMI